MAFSLADTDKVLLTAQALDAKGVPVPDAVTWSVSDPTIVAINNPTDTTVEAAAGVAGIATVSAQDALGLTAAFDIEVVAGVAASLTITAGDVTPQAPAV